MSFAKNSPRRLRNCEKSQISVREKTERYGSAVLEIIERFRTHPFTVPKARFHLPRRSGSAGTSATRL